MANFVAVLEYLMGLGVFSFLYWILDGIVKDMKVVSSTTGAYEILFMFWGALLIVYLLFGGWWLIRLFNEKEIPGGFR